MPTRQTSSSGRPKSPRIQVVLPEELCQRLSVLADDESRTVSNMAKVLIQQGVERLERLRLQDTGSGAAPGDGASPAHTPPLPMPASSPTSAGLPAAAARNPAATAPPPAVEPPSVSPPTSPPTAPSPTFPSLAVPPLAVPPPTSAAAPPPAAALSGAEGSGSGPVPGSDAAADRFRAELERNEAQGPRRLRGVPRRLRLRPPGG